ENGKPAKIVHYCNDEPCGRWEEYYENGKRKFIKEQRDSITLLWELNDENGRSLVANGNGSLTANDDNGLVRAMGAYKDGYQHGVWRFFHANGELDYEA